MAASGGSVDRQTKVTRSGDARDCHDARKYPLRCWGRLDRPGVHPPSLPQTEASKDHNANLFWSQQVTFWTDIDAFTPKVLARANDSFGLDWENHVRHVTALGALSGAIFVSGLSSTDNNPLGGQCLSRKSAELSWPSMMSNPHRRSRHTLIINDQSQLPSTNYILAVKSL